MSFSSPPSLTLMHYASHNSGTGRPWEFTYFLLTSWGFDRPTLFFYSTDFFSGKICSLDQYLQNYTENVTFVQIRNDRRKMHRHNHPPYKDFFWGSIFYHCFF